MPIGGAIRKYNIVDEEDKCLTARNVDRIDSAECQFPESLNQYQKTLNCTPWEKGRVKACSGLIPDEYMEICNSEITTGLGCLWL